ncbi:MAG: PEP-CTERM sorting domain-containing protein [Phycisphaeraceae bacterium]|nr:PEP-CTERM sorting domain-containing protein [Phycisphaeraceae bacterium]
MTKTAALMMVAAVGLASVANADVLWDQQPAYDNFNLPGFIDTAGTASQFGGSYANFVVSDVTVPAGGWTVQSVSTYFSDLSFQGTISTAVLNIFPKSGALPVAGNDPRLSPLGGGISVPVGDVRTTGGATVQPVMILTASGLNINLAAGEYWIGLTPTLTGGFFGVDGHWPTEPTIGAASASRYYDSQFGASPWTNDNPGVDAAITVTGVVPAPGAVALLGLGGLVATRRRRTN